MGAMMKETGERLGRISLAGLRMQETDSEFRNLLKFYQLLVCPPPMSKDVYHFSRISTIVSIVGQRNLFVSRFLSDVYCFWEESKLLRVHCMQND